MRNSKAQKYLVFLLIISLVLLILFQLSLLLDRSFIKYLFWLTLAWFVFLLIFVFIKKRELNGINLFLYLGQLTIILVLNFVIWKMK